MSGAAVRVSIVITCYNYKRYVAAAINSALAQTYPHVEIIVIDDGSTDGSDQVIAGYGDRIRNVRQENAGYIGAYNRGSRELSGDIVIFLDADDLLEPTAVEKVVTAWMPRCAKVQYDLSIIDGEGASLGRRFCNFVPGYDAAEVRAAFRQHATYRWPVTTGNAYARWFLDEVLPFKPGIGPDGYLNTIAPLYGDVITLPEPLGSYRIHGGNLWSSTGSDLDRLPHRIENRYKEIAFLREHAARRGVALPEGDILDHELVFVNYRLMVKKMGKSYQGIERDGTWRLWQQGVLAALREPIGPKGKLVHLVWLSSLLLSPRAVAQFLCTLRFNRAAIFRRFRRVSPA